MDEETETKPVFDEPMSLGFLLKGIQGISNIYSGTADPYKVARSRAKNKLARKSRRINRQRTK